jgi:5'-phosphate synthase pdxT subunit
MTTKKPQIAVLAMQGDFERHIARIKEIGADAYPARLPEDIERADGIILPGGESTTMSKLIVRYGVDQALLSAHRAGKPIYGTCAGMILLASEISSSSEERGGQYKLGILDITVARNAYGRQIDSFEIDLDIPAITGDTGEPIRAVFIRAPIVERVGPKVDILCKHGDRIVFVKQGNVIAGSFHPELTSDTRVHEYFLSLIKRQ